MPFSSKTEWMIKHPAWPWAVFVANTILISMAVASMLILGAQLHYLIREVGEIDRKLIQAAKISQTNINVVAKKAGVPEHQIVQPQLPIVPSVK